MTKIEELEWKLDTLTKMHKNAKEDYEKISNDLNECQKELGELKESKKEGKWLPNEGEEYWYRDVDGEIYFDDWNNHIFDKLRYDNTLLFPTKEACERYWRFMDTVKEKSYSFSEEEWEDDEIDKLVIYYDYTRKEFGVTCTWVCKYLGEIYFKDKESAQYIIDNFKDEFMEFIL